MGAVGGPGQGPAGAGRLSGLGRGLRRASVLVAVASDGGLMVVDEPFSGVFSGILDAEESSVIIVSRIPSAVRFDYLVVLEGGSVAYSGPYRDPASLGLALC